MADKKKKAPAKPVIGYGTNVKAGKAVTKSVKKKVVSKIVKAGTKTGQQIGRTYLSGDESRSAKAAVRFDKAINATKGNKIKNGLYANAALAAWKADTNGHFGGFTSTSRHLSAAERKVLNKKLIKKGVKKVNKALKK